MSINLIGSILNDKYEIVGHIGNGGMGIVFEAKDLVLERYVAIKLIRPEFSQTSNAMEAFIREARIIGQLEHPNILKVYELGILSIKGRPIIFLVMPLAKGGTLADRLKNAPLNVNEAIRVFTSICSAVDYAHQKGIIHLDLKPLNILFDNLENPLVADFGLSKLLDGVTHVKADTRVGTLAYMPPEQLYGHKAGTFSDVYALGITLFEMLTSRVPDRVWNGSIEFGDWLPSNLVAILQKATSPDPSLRFQNALEFSNTFVKIAQEPTSNNYSRGMTEISDISEFLSMGLAYLNEGNPKVAIEFFSRAITANPSCSEAYLYRGAIRSDLGDVAGALADLGQVIRLGSSDISVLINAHSIRGQIRLSESIDIEGAIADFNQAIARNSRDPKLYHMRGTAFGFVQAFDRAIADFNQSIALGSANFETFCLRGTAYEQLGQIAEAIQDYSEALRLNPLSAWAYFARAELLYKKEDFEASFTDYNQALQLDSSMEMAYCGRANVLRSSGYLDEAINDYTRAINLNVNCLKAYEGRAHVFSEKGDFNKAIADYTTVLDLNPNDSFSLCNRGFVHAKNGDLDSAIADFNQAIRLNPNDFMSYYNRGIAWKSFNNYDKAIADFNQALKIMPNFTAAYNERGSAKKAKGDFNGALEDFNRAINLNPQFSFAYINRAEIREKRGDLRGAIEDLSQSLSLNPRSADAFQKRALVRGAIGDFKGAVADYTEAIRLTPNAFTFYFFRATLLIDMGYLDKAIADLTQSLKLNPTSPAYYCRGVAYMRKGNLDQAISDYNSALELQPDAETIIRIYLARSEARKANGDKRGAKKDENEAQRLGNLFQESGMLGKK